MNKAIRAAVVARASGRCEACGTGLGPDSERGHFDHFFSRRHGESVETGWLLCPPCDQLKTANHPSAAHWLEKFVVHCALAILKDAASKPAYFDAMDLAMTKRASNKAKFGSLSSS